MKGNQGLRKKLLVFVMAWPIVLGVLFCTGCSLPLDAEEPSANESTQVNDEDAQEKQSDEQGETSEEAEAIDEPVEWPDECLDRHGDITVYALAELTGEQLNTLLEEQDYAWSERNQMWLKIDGSAALVVNDADGAPLPKDKIAALGTGSSEAATSYRIVTSEYSNVKRVVNNLARRIMECEDVEYLDSSGIAVVSGPSDHRCLLYVNKNNNVFTVSVYSEQAVSEGLFNGEVGQELGTSIDEAFEALTARVPGSE